MTAGPDGDWTADVELRRGRNQFDVTAIDPDTGKRSEDTIRLFITVPFPPIEAPTLTVDQPAEGTSFENGAIPVAGRATNARRSSSAPRTWAVHARGAKARQPPRRRRCPSP